jgi:hypothetical protein
MLKQHMFKQNSNIFGWIFGGFKTVCLNIFKILIFVALGFVQTLENMKKNWPLNFQTRFILLITLGGLIFNLIYNKNPLKTEIFL